MKKFMALMIAALLAVGAAFADEDYVIDLEDAIGSEWIVGQWDLTMYMTDGEDEIEEYALVTIDGSDEDSNVTLQTAEGVEYITLYEFISTLSQLSAATFGLELNDDTIAALRAAGIEVNGDFEWHYFETDAEYVGCYFLFSLSADDEQLMIKIALHQYFFD